MKTQRIREPVPVGVFPERQDSQLKITKLSIKITQNNQKHPSVLVSLLPIATLLLFFVGLLVFKGADAISEYSHVALLGASALALLLAWVSGTLSRSELSYGVNRSAEQIMPTVPMLIFISMVSTTWMLSGVVPTLIDYGMRVLNPTFFLVIACAVCAVISVLTGSSWTTIATIGVAFMGIGTVMGYSAGWTAGAIISGAYFGDKVSPLSDTTVVASSACGVDLFKHIRYLSHSTVPAMSIALVVFALRGIFGTHISAGGAEELLSRLDGMFNFTPWVFVIPAATVVMLAMRLSTTLTLGMSSMLGLIGIIVLQPQLFSTLVGMHGSSAADYIGGIYGFLIDPTEFSTGLATLDSLVSTGGVDGMLSTVKLIVCAMVFGGVLMGTGMLTSLSSAITTRLSRRFPTVAATVGSGLFLNACTADQYLAIIIGGNMYSDVYRRAGLESKLLSRTMEDSVSVTSVLIPWNTCGITQSTVLGISTFAYFPYCLFNYLSPLMTLLLAYTGYKIKQLKPTTASAASGVAAKRAMR